MIPSLHIVRPGLLTTVQDLGRAGYQNLGIAVGGALDPVALRAANALVGKFARHRRAGDALSRPNHRGRGR
jgi:allophanate hydrolase subunit 2